MNDETARPVAIITGSARGIGLGVAKDLASRGWRTHAVYRSRERLAELEERFPGRVHEADLTRSEDCRRLVSSVLERDGRIDGVVHSVGEYEAGPLEGFDDETFDRLIQSNLTSAFRLTTAVRQSLRDANGSLVYFGCAGLDSLRARSDAAAYVTAKTGLLVFMRSIAKEEAAFGVRANMVSPGLVPHADSSADTQSLASDVPLGRPGTPEDVAQAVAYLLSAEAAHVTGQNLEVAGGWML